MSVEDQFPTGIPYIPSKTSKKLKQASKRLKIRGDETLVAQLRAENDRLKIALADEKHGREVAAREAQLAAARNIMTPEDVMAELSVVAREGSDEDTRTRALCKLADVYTLSKRDHGADSRVDKFNNLSGASDDELDSALNRGVVGQ